MSTPPFDSQLVHENTVMTTPIVIEIVRNGNPVGKPTRNRQATPPAPSSDRVW
jgi:hypothetical protein